MANDEENKQSSMDKLNVSTSRKATPRTLPRAWRSLS
jgi:hypothetical protein